MEDTYCMRRVLERLSAERGTADVITMNGYHITGKVLEWDSRSILMEVNGLRQLVLLHAVSTVVPMGTQDAGE